MKRAELYFLMMFFYCVIIALIISVILKFTLSISKAETFETFEEYVEADKQGKEIDCLDLNEDITSDDPDSAYYRLPGGNLFEHEKESGIQLSQCREQVMAYQNAEIAYCKDVITKFVSPLNNQTPIEPVAFLSGGEHDVCWEHLDSQMATLFYDNNWLQLFDGSMIATRHNVWANLHHVISLKLEDKETFSNTIPVGYYHYYRAELSFQLPNQVEHVNYYFQHKQQRDDFASYVRERLSSISIIKEND